MLARHSTRMVLLAAATVLILAVGSDCPAACGRYAHPTRPGVRPLLEATSWESEGFGLSTDPGGGRGKPPRRCVGPSCSGPSRAPLADGLMAEIHPVEASLAEVATGAGADDTCRSSLRFPGESYDPPAPDRPLRPPAA